MDLHVHTELQGELLVATATGMLAFEPVLHAWKGLCDLAAEKQVHKILVNALAVDGTFSTMERYELAIQVTEHLRQIQFNPRIAFVGLPPASDGFGVRVAQNRNVCVEMFPSVEQALSWLAKWPAPS